MKEIKTVSIIGLGALGILYANHLSKAMPRKDLRIIAGKERIERYKKDHIHCNGIPCNFNYFLPEEKPKPADLLIFAVKYNGLADALKDVRNHVGENTILLSLLNGITSESIIGETYGMDKIVYCVAQGMDALKTGNKMTYANMGTLCIGRFSPESNSPNIQAVAYFFEKTKTPHIIDDDMRRRLWGKFMMNTGVNQVAAVLGTCYGDIQKEGFARDTMVQAMREVAAISEKEGVNLNEQDIAYWLKIGDSLNPSGKPSMRQDIEAKRPTEAELFSGTAIKLGKKYNIPTPVNIMLYEKIKEAELHYNR